MIRFLVPRLLAAVLLLSGVAGTVLFASQPALAQWDDDDAGSQVSFDAFHDRLAPYGNWFETERWGTVWQPRDVGPGFRPYYDGHWVYTDDYGWYWDSNEDGGWGDIVYHYGRWVYDPNDGWLWVPGYVWGPAWVVWRSGDGMTGWFPMPPDDAFYNGDDLNDDWSGYAGDDYYGYRSWYGGDFAPTFYSLWVFVPDDHFTDRHFHRYARRDRDRDDTFFRRTRDATRYGRADGYVVNRGVDPDRLYRRTGRRVVPVQLRKLRRRNAPAPMRINRGREIRQRMLRERPNLMPRARRPDRQEFRQRMREQRQEFRQEQRQQRMQLQRSPSAPPPVQRKQRQEFRQQMREQRQEFRQEQRQQRQQRMQQQRQAPPRAERPRREAPPPERKRRKPPE